MQRLILTPALLLLSLMVMAGQGYLGISVDKATDGATEGLRVVNVYDDGAAWVAGLQENDLITRFNGMPVTDSETFNRMLSGYQWGDQVELTYLRDQSVEKASITLGFDVRTKTYEILKSEQITGEVIWYFRDNTTIIMQGETPLSITKKFEDGVKETYDLTAVSDLTRVPRRFADLTDKLEVISQCIAEQEIRGTDADHITFIKEALNRAEPTAGLVSLTAEKFNVYPNPTTGPFEVELLSDASGVLSWDIYDVRGASVASGTEGAFDGSFKQQFELTGKFSGTYLLYIRVGNERISQQIIIH